MVRVGRLRSGLVRMTEGWESSAIWIALLISSNWVERTVRFAGMEVESTVLLLVSRHGWYSGSLSS